MASAHELFSKFDSKIALDDLGREPGLRRISNCIDPLMTKYYTSDTKLTTKITLLGSLSKGTGIKPLTDADVLFHMPPGTYNRFDDYAGNGQSALLQEVRDALKTKYPRTDIRGDGPVVVVNFTDLPAVEIVPGTLVPTESDILHVRTHVPVTRDGGDWELVDYGAQRRGLEAADVRVEGQLRRLLRYMKAWRKSSGATIKSMALELMAIDFMATWDRSQLSHTYDDWLVRGFLRYMIDNYGRTYLLPGTAAKYLDTGIGWYTQAVVARDNATSACTNQDTDFLYVHYWRRVLGDQFGT